jgi:hypothetical protein
VPPLRPRSEQLPHDVAVVVVVRLLELVAVRGGCVLSTAGR